MDHAGLDEDYWPSISFNRDHRGGDYARSQDESRQRANLKGAAGSNNPQRFLEGEFRRGNHARIVVSAAQALRLSIAEETAALSAPSARQYIETEPEPANSKGRIRNAPSR